MRDNCGAINVKQSVKNNKNVNFKTLPLARIFKVVTSSLFNLSGILLIILLRATGDAIKLC